MGKIPVCIFPRMDFMLLAMNQIVNHLDKPPLFGRHPKGILKTTVGQKTPLDAGPQHTQNHTEACKFMFKTVRVRQVTRAQDVKLAYEDAMSWPGSSLIVENSCG